MNPIRKLIGRRRFLAGLGGSALAMAFGRINKAFDLFFKTGVAKAAEIPADVKNKPLKGIVVYYSATGNTAQVANAIYKGMKSVIDCDVAPIKKLNPSDMSKYDVMAFGAPNWYHRAPVITNIFSNDMPRMDGKHCIIFGTHGGDPVAQFWFLSRNILKKGMTIIGWSDWYGSDFMTPHSSVPDGEWGHPDEIDLKEAEAFGKQMAENSQRIYDGETVLIPEVPKPPAGESDLWSPRLNELDNITFASPPPNSLPRFDLTKCIFPRCTQCIDICPVHAIDLSMITPGSTMDSPLVTKEACQHCGGICARACYYDAISYEGEDIKTEFDMNKCTYPKCTLCVDECPQDSIDFSTSTPIVHQNCESCCLCWGICPEGAIEIVNMAEIHLKKAWWFRGTAMEGGPGGGPMAGEGEGHQAQEMMMRSAPRFRDLILEEDREDSAQLMFMSPPRVILNKEKWPYRIKEG